MFSPFKLECWGSYLAGGGEGRGRVLSLRRDVTEEKALHSEWGLRRTVIDAELLALKQGPLAGIRMNGRHPWAGQERMSSSSTTPLVCQLSSSGLIQLYELQEASPTLASEKTSMLNQMDLLPLFGDSILTLSPASAPSLQDSSMDLDLWLNSNPQEFDPHVLDEFMAVHGPALFLDSNSANTANTWNVVADTASAADHHHQLGYIGPAYRENWNLGRASQELPPLPPPHVTPSPSPSKPEELIPNAEGSDEMIAPQNIDLSFSEHNILVGKRRRTQSTRAADAAEARPIKKGLRRVP
ncbi:hypothetical protein DFH08DRAFT_818465 [Mycena albidolilacea]|uniref:Uncharacterized protein n=1 Tax=Mycena albidolilacea TaxID=1033008 RepID=A0AAD6ZGQ1_9AGAR|nr:hypothetical protein DFH08DRAFT_818465 [Mycena albidolilacea]